MDGRIEIMDRRRRSLLTWLFWGFGIWYGMLIAYVIMTINLGGYSIEDSRYRFLDTIKPYYLGAGLLVAAAFFILLVRWWFFKRSLQNDAALRSAVNDERVQQSWLKAFRFAFFCLIALFALNACTSFFLLATRTRGPILYAWVGMFSRMHLHFFVAVMSCLGSFLYYTRER